MGPLLALFAGVWAAAAPIAADFTRIKKLGWNSYSDEPFESPYIAVFSSSGKRLIFVSADHSDGTDTPMAKTMRLALKRFKPQIVVVEGLTANSSEDREMWREQALEFAKSSRAFPENYYAAYLAHKSGLPFIGGEPSARASLENLKPKGFTAEDFLGFLAARNVVSQNGRKPRTAAEFSEALDGWLMEEARKLGHKKGFSFAAFELWCERRAKVGKPANALEGEADLWSKDEPGPGLLKAIDYHHDLFRERVIVEQIEASLNKHDRVMVVYGSGHLVAQREVWKNALGASKDFKPY